MLTDQDSFNYLFLQQLDRKDLNNQKAPKAYNYFITGSLDLFFVFSIWVLFHEHSRFAGQQGKGEVISLTPLYQFHPLNRHLDISRAIITESPSLLIARSQARTECGIKVSTPHKSIYTE